MSKDKQKLTCNHTQFNGLHAAFDGLRKKSTEVTVDKEALWNLLQDHAVLMAIHEGKVQDTEEAPST